MVKGSEIVWRRMDFVAATWTASCSGRLIWSGIHKKETDVVVGDSVKMYEDALHDRID